MLIVEFSKQYKGKGYFKSTPQGHLFYSVWLGWIAVTWTSFDFFGIYKVRSLDTKPNKDVKPPKFDIVTEGYKPDISSKG